MRVIKAGAIVVTMATLGMVITGCSGAQKGAAAGGLAGGVAGAIIGNNFGNPGPMTGAAVGGSSGAAVGGIAGDAFDQMNEKDMERELQNLRAELMNRDAELAALKAYGLDPEKLMELAAARERLNRLESDLAAARAAAEGAQGDTAARDAELAALAAERDALRAQLANADANKNLTDDLLRQAERDAQALRDQIKAKEDALASVRNEMDVLRTSLSGKEEALDGLRKELEFLNVELDQTSRGLTLTIVDSLLYTPGRAELSKDGQKLVGDVANILNERFPNRELLVEGHTDNEPIKFSGWRSNWELGSARALSLVHELTSVHGFDPARLSATSYGEFRPAATNATEQGRKLNRRAVIVILPEEVPVMRETLARAD